MFETLLVLDGHVRKLPAHLSRMQHSAAVLELEVPGHEAWERAIVTALDEYQRAVGPLTEVVVKLVATRGVEGAHEATCWVAASAPAPAAKRQREEGIDVLLLDRGYDSDLGERAPWLLLGAKTLSYAVNMAALRYAHSHGADDVIFTSSDGQVLEGPTSTVLLAHAETDDAGRVTARRLVTRAWIPASSRARPRGPYSPRPRRPVGSSGTGRSSRTTCSTPTPCGSSPRCAS